MTVEMAMALQDELWKLRGYTYDVRDGQVSFILSRYGRILQDIIAYLPKQETYDDMEESEK